MSKVSPSVLIIRLDGIGDALALAPTIAALHRRSIPVDVLLSESNAGVFSARAVRRAITSDVRLRSSSRTNAQSIERLGAALGAHRYSHVLVATEDPAGYRLARATRAPIRIGFTNGWGKPLKGLWARRFLTHTVFRSAGLDPRAPHECAVLFGLAAPLLAGEEPTHDLSLLRPLVLENEPAADGRIAIQATTKWQRLGMSLEDVAMLVRGVAAIGRVHLLSAPAEALYADELARWTGVAISYFSELDAWKNAIGAAAAIVAPDSGAMHVAAMVGTPVVAIFPPSRHYARQAARWSPWAAPHRIIPAAPAWPSRATEALESLLSASS